jgi:hypothetical protein
MIVSLIGRIFRVAARIAPGGPRPNLDHVGAELVRLERAPPQRPASSR